MESFFLMELSIVTTLYRSEKFIKEFYERMKNCIHKITTDFEIIFVDDGSDDHSLDILNEIAVIDNKVKVVELSKNFGHHRAIMVGLGYAQGDFIFLIDSDLEEEPEYLLKFHQKILESDADVIYGVQGKRKGGWFEKCSGWLFYKLVNHFCEVSIPENLTTLRLMKKKYVQSLFLYNESVSNIAFLLAITGFKQLPVVIKKYDKGSSEYTLRKKIRLLSDTIISFSDKPLIYIFRFGTFISLISFMFVIYLVSKKILYNSLLLGWTSTIVSIWLFGGLILFSLGLIGIYLRRILLETKKRPNANGTKISTSI